MAKQMCDEDSNCSAILKVIPTLCGPELVACSTVTVSRCQAALRTLVVFPWFQPTCLCREPRLDPQCNAFRDLLFDHPCVFVSRKDVDMHPMLQIPTCERAANICMDNAYCKQRLEFFKGTCQFRDGHCRNPNREDCLRAWLQLRKTPLLGCICPDGNDKTCSYLYTLVNENPCVEGDYPARVAAMAAISEEMKTTLTKQPPVPTAAATLLIISSSQTEPRYPMSTIYHYPELPSTSKADHKASLEQLKHVAGTCQSALADCVGDAGCKSHLDLITRNCEEVCNQIACKSAIQDIYKYLMDANKDLALKIALCVCRDTTEHRQAECKRAQRKLHPSCAEEMTDTHSISQCHNIGQECRKNRVCRYRLEYYELSCAADTMTGRCAGQHQMCMMSMLGLLGTDLHTNCMCKGHAFHNINQCLAWKRLLWGNPCVVESLLTYHLSQPSFGVDTHLPVPAATAPNTYNGVGKNILRKGGHAHGKKHPSTYKSTPAEESFPYDSGSYEPVHPRHDIDAELVDLEGEDSRLQVRKVASTPQSDHTVPHAAPAIPSSTTTTTTTTSTTTTRSTTTITPTTTLPERYCEIKKSWDSKTHIIEEQESIRLYKNNDRDCSELCYCVKNLTTICKVLDCVERRPCETDFAVYNHNAPGFQVARGECICYSGEFICKRPRQDEYDLPTGLFLLLGYSRIELHFLNETSPNAVNSLIPLQNVFQRLSAELGGDCHLELYQATTDNLILQVRHSQMAPGNRNRNYSLYMMQEERDRCEAPAKKLETMINKRDPRIHHNVRLSLFVLAEVMDNVPSLDRISSGIPSVKAKGVGHQWWAWFSSFAGGAIVRWLFFHRRAEGDL
ncbi:uncharacterized protein [Macrobrachium rosenbergii]|uniref:uncharacterized protein n=1 Tax=Macrobrachium rosenbergii TaxID=79674 RepID=UPI0034D6E988